MGTKIASSRITAQGQISVPAAVRRRLGAQPGSVLDWEEENGAIVVHRAGGVTSEQIRAYLFPDGPPKPVSLKDMDDAIAAGIVERYERSRH